MPHRFVDSNGKGWTILEAWVQHLNGELRWVWKPADPVFATGFSNLQDAHGPWPRGL